MTHSRDSRYGVGEYGADEYGDSESDLSEYDVVSFRVRAGTLSIFCALFPITFGILADELPFLLGGRLRPYYGQLLVASLLICLIGIVAGAFGQKTPESRITGRLGILVNTIVLLLLGLFVMIFRWIRWGQLSWF